MRPITSFTLHAVLAAAIAALATASAAAQSPPTLRIVTETPMATKSEQIEALSYSWRRPQAAGRVSKVDGFTIKQGVKPADPGRNGEWIADVERPQGKDGDMTLKGSKIGQNSAASGGVSVASGDISSDSGSAASRAPAGKGTVWVRVASPWSACRIGARYPSLELGDGAKRYVLQDVTVADCGGNSAEEIAFYYNKIAFNYASTRDKP